MSSEAKLEAGCKIEANYRGLGKWYPGKIKLIRDDGTFDIDYDDGETESKVTKELVRLFENIANITGLQVGAKVEGDWVLLLEKVF